MANPLDKPVTLVIIGATGDLTRRLLLPAIYHLYAVNKWPAVKIVGYAMESWTKEKFLTHIEDNLKTFAPQFDPAVWAKFAPLLDYQAGDLTPASLKALNAFAPGPTLFYLALPPQLFGTASQGLGEAGLASEDSGWRRLVVEKPFGWDLASATALRKQMHEHWQEDQIYRIDHFLGKETAQNWLVFRFANRFLESVWNAEHIAQVQITVSETLGLEGRFAYYDKAGALRDMLQNHLMQLFALTAMDPPATWVGDVLREHKVEVLQAVRTLPSDAIDGVASRGQYTGGTIDQKEVPGYLQEPHIPGDSGTETFAALRLTVDNWRWQGVPFYLRSGKRLAATVAEIAVEFRPGPDGLFGKTLNNWVIFRMWPDERIEVMAWAKEPAVNFSATPIVLATPYEHTTESDATAYEELLLDVLNANRVYFLRFDEVEEAWRIVQPVLDAWAHGKPEAYAAGSQGPAGQERLMSPGQSWRPIELP